MIAFFSSKRGKTKCAEYRKMKFCEMFHISPIEYDYIPAKEVDMWLMMKNLESQFENEQGTKSSNYSRR